MLMVFKHRSGICVVMSAISIACQGGNMGHGSGTPAYNVFFATKFTAIAMISVSLAQIFRAVVVLTK